MEEEIMEIKDFIKIYDNILPLNTLSSFLKFANTRNFEKASVIGHGNGQNVVNDKIRKVFNYALTTDINSCSETHWFNLLYRFFIDHIGRYCKELNSDPYHVVSKVHEITILKYQDDGHYDWHTDHHAQIPRTLSLVYLTNNDYEGGELIFKNLKTGESLKIDKVPNRLIIWPSNFMYPHKVNPVTKGTRFSVVCWAL
jgi:hypothetical protein